MGYPVLSVSRFPVAAEGWDRRAPLEGRGIIPAGTKRARRRSDVDLSQAHLTTALVASFLDNAVHVESSPWRRGLSPGETVGLGTAWGPSWPNRRLHRHLGFSDRSALVMAGGLS